MAKTISSKKFVGSGCVLWLLIFVFWPLAIAYYMTKQEIVTEEVDSKKAK